MDSIIQTEKECFFCGRTTCLHDHHVFFGNKNKKHSEKCGLKVWLCVEHHTGNESPHRSKEMNLFLKRIAQAKFEENHSHKEFMDIFKKNYL